MFSTGLVVLLVILAAGGALAVAGTIMWLITESPRSMRFDRLYDSRRPSQGHRPTDGA